MNNSYKHSSKIFFLQPFSWVKFFTESLTLSDNGVAISRGIINSQTIDIPYIKINSIVVYKTLLGKILGYGNIGIFSANATTPEIFQLVDNPDQIKNNIQEKLK